MQCRPPDRPLPDQTLLFILYMDEVHIHFLSYRPRERCEKLRSVIGATVQPPYGTRGAGPPTFEDDGTTAFWSLSNFVTRRVLINLNFTANSPNSWITYGVICFERSKAKRFFTFWGLRQLISQQITTRALLLDPQGALPQINHAIGQHTLYATFPRD